MSTLTILTLSDKIESYLLLSVTQLTGQPPGTRASGWRARPASEAPSASCPGSRCRDKTPMAFQDFPLDFQPRVLQVLEAPSERKGVRGEANFQVSWTRVFYLVEILIS